MRATHLIEQLVLLQLSVPEGSSVPEVVRARAIRPKSHQLPDHHHLQRHCENDAYSDILATLHMFAVPRPLELAQGSVIEPVAHDISLIDRAGHQKFGVCLRLPTTMLRLETNLLHDPSSATLFGATEVCCILLLSSMPAFATLRAICTECVAQIDFARTQHQPSTLLEDFLCNVIHSVSLPDHEFAVQLSLPLTDVPLAVNPLCGKLAVAPDPPLLQLDFALDVLFTSLSINNILLVLSAVLLERRVFIHSTSPTAAARACEIIRAMIAPMPLAWAAVFVPTLPHALADMLEAPTMYLMGGSPAMAPQGESCLQSPPLHQDRWRDSGCLSASTSELLGPAASNPETEPDLNALPVVVVDIDTDQVSNVGRSPCLPFTELLRKELRAALGWDWSSTADSIARQDPAHAPPDARARNEAVQFAVLTWWAKVLGGVRSCTHSVTGHFVISKWLARFGDGGDRTWARSFAKTSMFVDYVSSWSTWPEMNIHGPTTPTAAAISFDSFVESMVDQPRFASAPCLVGHDVNRGRLSAVSAVSPERVLRVNLLGPTVRHNADTVVYHSRSKSGTVRQEISLNLDRMESLVNRPFEDAYSCTLVALKGAGMSSTKFLEIIVPEFATQEPVRSRDPSCHHEKDELEKHERAVAPTLLHAAKFHARPTLLPVTDPTVAAAAAASRFSLEGLELQSISCSALAIDGISASAPTLDAQAIATLLEQSIRTFRRYGAIEYSASGRPRAAVLSQRRQMSSVLRALPNLPDQVRPFLHLDPSTALNHMTSTERCCVLSNLRCLMILCSALDLPAHTISAVRHAVETFTTAMLVSPGLDDEKIAASPLLWLSMPEWTTRGPAIKVLWVERAAQDIEALAIEYVDRTFVLARTSSGGHHRLTVPRICRATHKLVWNTTSARELVLWVVAHLPESRTAQMLKELELVKQECTAQDQSKNGWRISRKLLVHVLHSDSQFGLRFPF
ncbi:AEX-3 domain-containing protein [Blastocladiella britannica]|nr:AEX-3 domain-containing protein [Blastocladiella britannica]